jgi:hypothetical protein
MKEHTGKQMVIMPAGSQSLGVHELFQAFSAWHRRQWWSFSHYG